LTKPWRIGVMSGGLLNNKEYLASGFMSPGFCPNNPKMNDF